MCWVSKPLVYRVFELVTDLSTLKLSRYLKFYHYFYGTLGPAKLADPFPGLGNVRWCLL